MGIEATADDVDERSALLDVAVLEDLLAAGGVEFVEELAKVLSDSMPQRIASLSAALAVGDIATLLAVAHRLKGGAATIGARDLATRARGIEAIAHAGALDAAALAIADLATATDRYRAALRAWSLANAAR